MAKAKRVGPAYNLHALMDALETSLNLTPEQKFRTAAQIKRYVHGEKYGLLARLLNYSEYRLRLRGNKRQRKKNNEGALRFVQNVIREKLETHREWATLPDESVITYNMGSFTYPPHKAVDATAQA